MTLSLSKFKCASPFQKEVNILQIKIFLAFCNPTFRTRQWLKSTFAHEYQSQIQRR